MKAALSLLFMIFSASFTPLSWVASMPMAGAPTPPPANNVAIPPAALAAQAAPMPSATPVNRAAPAASMPSVAAPTAVTKSQPVTGQIPVPQPPTTTAPVAPTPQASINDAQLKELEDALRGLEETKHSLAKLLSELDTKLLDARKQAAEAKTLSFALLEKQKEAEAKSDFEKIRAASQQVKDTQQFVQNEFTKEFNDKMAAIKVKATQADATLKAINAQKAASAKPASAAAIPTAAPTPTPNAPAPTLTGNSDAVRPTRQKVQAAHGLMDNLTSGIAKAIQGIRSFFGGEEPIKKKTVNTPAEPIPTDPAIRAQQATSMIQQMDQGIATLDATRNTIQQYLASINQSSQYIESLAKQTPEGNKILVQSKKKQAITSEPAWKQKVLKTTSLILDGIGYLASNLYELFDATVGSFMRNLVKDVKKKIAMQDSAKVTPAAA